jgi:hypothetical protein
MTQVLLTALLALGLAAGMWLSIAAATLLALRLLGAGA